MGDRERTLRLLTAASANPVTAAAWMVHVEDLTQDFVGAPGVWAEIVSLAELLLEHGTLVSGEIRAHLQALRAAPPPPEAA
jgi:hypothetical protein